MIILIGGEKGGTGKTTISTNLATMRAKAGKDVLLVDADPQASATMWAEARSVAALSRVTCIQKMGEAIRDDVLDLARKYDDVIVDTGGRNSVELRLMLLIADLTIIPIQPSQFDIWTLSALNTLVGNAKALNTNSRAKLIISRAASNPSINEIEEVKKLIIDFKSVEQTGVVIKDRIAFRKAAMQGKSVVELNPIDKKASEEIQALYNEVFLQP